MAVFRYTLADATTGQRLQGAAVSDTINTSGCKKNWLGQTEGGCTSGPGFIITGNTDVNGQLIANPRYNCGMSHTITCSAPGYNATTVTVQTIAPGNTGTYDVTPQPIQLTPLANVAQTNQGTGSSVVQTQNSALSTQQNVSSSLTDLASAAQTDVVLLVVLAIIAGIAIIAIAVVVA